MTLLDPTYAKKYIPIIASVSEHQPTSWSSYFFDLQHLMVFMPAGFYFCINKELTYGKLFIAIYGVLATYFSCVMIRLMLVLAPAACILAGIGVSELFRVASQSVREWLLNERRFSQEVVDDLNTKKQPSKKKQTDTRKVGALPVDMSCCVMLIIVTILASFVLHSTFVAAEAYSSPSIILASKRQDGSRVIIDDFREAYYWLKQNTEKDAKILSWWDYGYQITGMANRTVLVDNNTWNNTHIATVGKAFGSTEEEAYKICNYLDANYVLVIFGGYSHYSGDDISKFLWMIRIAGKLSLDRFPSWRVPSHKRSSLLQPRPVPRGQRRLPDDAELPDVQAVLLPLRRDEDARTAPAWLRLSEGHAHRQQRLQTQALRRGLLFREVARQDLQSSAFGEQVASHAV